MKLKTKFPCCFFFQTPVYRITFDDFYAGNINLKKYYRCTFDVCEFCGKLFPGINHFENEHAVEYGRFKCRFCSNVYRGKYKFFMHLVKHHGAMFKCQYCDYKTFLHCDLNSHLNSFHSNDKYKCNSCDFKSNNEYKIEDHVLLHLVHDLFNIFFKLKMGSYQCPDPKCGFTSNDLCYLKLHFSSHFGNTLFACNHCSFGSKFKSTVERHMSKQHYDIFSPVLKRKL